MLFQEVIMITGQPGLFRALTMANNGMVVEDLDTKQRKRIPNSNSIGSLAEMSLYLQDEETIPLRELFVTMTNQAEVYPAPSAKASDEELRAYFEAVVPDYDRDRVYPSVMKKVLRWFHQLSPLVDFNPEASENESNEGAEVEAPTVDENTNEETKA